MILEISDEDIEIFNNHFIYKLTYIETGAEVSKDDVINAGEEKNVTLTIASIRWLQNFLVALIMKQIPLFLLVI